LFGDTLGVFLDGGKVNEKSGFHGSREVSDPRFLIARLALLGSKRRVILPVFAISLDFISVGECGFDYD
jgi:hypothetical protein